jgi:hydroxymethylpyrimidine pyrophosphatase-like HAD family hydrolase
MSTRWTTIAVDYDGTLARHGVVDAATVAALERARAGGITLILVSGRELESLEVAFGRLDLFARVVVENGAVLFEPRGRDIRALAPPANPPFVSALRARGVDPLCVGRVIVATREPHVHDVLEAIRDVKLELEVIFNKGAVMVLPSGVNKASGLGAALAELGIPSERVIGIGDAENDHSLLAACGLKVAVANAVTPLQAEADLVTPSDHGAGVAEIIDAVLQHQLERIRPAYAPTQILEARH